MRIVERAAKVAFAFTRNKAAVRYAVCRRRRAVNDAMVVCRDGKRFLGNIDGKALGCRIAAVITSPAIVAVKRKGERGGSGIRSCRAGGIVGIRIRRRCRRIVKAICLGVIFLVFRGAGGDERLSRYAAH